MRGKWNKQIRQWMQITYGWQIFLFLPFGSFAWGCSLHSLFHGMTAFILVSFMVDRVVGAKQELYEITAFLPFDLEEYRQYIADKAWTIAMWKAGGTALVGLTVTFYLDTVRKELVFDGKFWFEFLFFAIFLVVFFMQSYLSVIADENAKYRKWKKKYYCKQCLPKADRVLHNLSEGLFYLICIYMIPVLSLPGGEGTGSITGEISWGMGICFVFSGLALVVNSINFVRNRKQMLESTGTGDYNAKDGVE